jgi:hypothetical protein
MLALAVGVKDIGRQIVSIPARSPFEAAVNAEKFVDGIYGGRLYSHALRVVKVPAAGEEELRAA